MLPNSINFALILVHHTRSFLPPFLWSPTKHLRTVPAGGGVFSGSLYSKHAQSLNKPFSNILAEGKQKRIYLTCYCNFLLKTASYALV
jgi:hypothetical protein